MFVASATTPYFYNSQEDGWLELPSSAFGGTSLSGACGTYHPHGPSGTATAGSSTTLTTNLTLPRSIAGFKIRIVGGPGAGSERTIASNTWGANSVITVTQPFSAAITNASTYILLTGRYWFLMAGTLSITGFGYWDPALNAWVAGKSITGAPATLTTEGKLIATANGVNIPVFATGTASGGGATTLDCAGNTWTVNQWANSQVRITAGTGIGQIRTIASNTNTQLTVSVAWTANPSVDSVFVIEGNDDYLYLMGNAAITAYRYSIYGSAGPTGANWGGAGNVWTTLAPITPRAGILSAGGSADWVHSATDAAWTNESAIQNGRYIYSHRGFGSQAVDLYDIPGNTWIARAFGNQGLVTFTNGSSHAYYKNRIYFQKDNTGRIYALDVTKNLMEGYSTILWPQSTAVAGNKAWIWKYQSDGDELAFCYFLSNSALYLQRTMLLLD